MPSSTQPPAPAPAALAAGPADDTPALQALLAEAVRLALAHAPGDGHHATAVPGLLLVRASAPALPLPAVYEPGLVVVLQGRKQALLGQEPIRYDPLHCLVVSVKMLPCGQITEASPEAPYLCLRLSLDAQHLAALMLEAGDAAESGAAAGPRRGAAVAATPASPSPSPSPARGLHVSRVSLPLLDAVLRLLRLLDTPQHLPVLAPLAMREILYRVLVGELGAPLRALAMADGQTQRIARAIDLLERRFAEPVRIEELAAAAHMSVSSLHQHFKQVTSLSPLQYQKQLRLHQARRLMLASGIDAASAAHRVGYESASQFSREYRRLFGAPPRTEIEQIKGAATLET
ncbi:AraC family transcriptional regulator [Aquabacterium sp. OR-4]|uniref:AraC family transcriptional regulator n=1 Tax=Aquabacterium sp. OR-4 TaxID=2978127 RepID=UPI0021B20506|nr:AraC family transcriptional regulator [Aquabacterium sp. OR-4]MDT7837892.1 AraC family transcriptional regulator [Aquabacterium sp. OR-4]